MNIVVCVKQVPDTTAKKDFGSDFRINRGELESVINPFDEYAIEEGLRLKEALGGEVTILTMGPESAEEMIRKALAMGADRAVLVTDPSLSGTDSWGTVTVLAAALRSMSFDLVLTGMESTDARTGLVPGGLAEKLDIPGLTFAAKVDVVDGTVKIQRQVSGGYQEVESALPALVGVVKGVNEPRYPSLKGIMAAKRKEIQKMPLAHLNLEPSEVGLAGAKMAVLAAEPRPEKVAGQVLKPETPEDAARQIAEYLQANKFI